MPSFELTDEQLKKALTIYSGNLLFEIPEDEVLQVSQSFSARFEARMQKLIQKAKLSPQRLHRQMASRVAMILLIFTLGTTALMTVDAIRLPVIRFITEVHQTFTRIVFGAEEESTVLPDKNEQTFVPGFVPEGFELEFEFTDDSSFFRKYIYENDCFAWNQYSSHVAIHLDTEGVTTEELVLSGISCLYFENKGIKTLVWEQYGYIFICDGTVEKDMLIKIAESLRENF